MLTWLIRILWGNREPQLEREPPDASEERVAFEKARLEYCLDVFNREEARREQLERKAQFYLSFITLILGALFFQAENLTLVAELIRKENVAPLLITITYITIIILGLSILFSVMAVLGVTRLWSYRGPYPEEFVFALFSPESDFIDEQNQEDFIRTSALNFAIALDFNKTINDRKSRWIMLSSYSIFLTVVMLAVLLAILVYLSITY